MYLGIDGQSSLIYEGSGGVLFPVFPTPSVTQAKLIESKEDWSKLPTGILQSPFECVFREDTFDAVTRTRRGRLYFSSEPGQPSLQSVAPNPYENSKSCDVGVNGLFRKSLFSYMACTSLLSKRNQGKGLTLVLGTVQASSAWRIIQTEIQANECVMVTLKALTAFGIVPEINKNEIKAESSLLPITQAMNRVLDSAFRETPISVIDHCRNAMAVILSRWLVQEGHDESVLAADLGKIRKLVTGKPYELQCSAHLADVIARLHSRGKANEQHTRDLRVPVEEDAELALQALGFVIRDIGWALA
jgi:hypothetical protein